MYGGEEKYIQMFEHTLRKSKFCRCVISNVEAKQFMVSLVSICVATLTDFGCCD